MAEPFPDTIFEEKEDFMVSPTGRTPTLRTAHFLKPTVNSINGPVLKLPSLLLSSESMWPLKISFNGWKDPQRKWQKWVHRMHSLHQSVWKQAGIYDAVLGSMYKTRRNNGVVFGIAERWCSETNTFIFPWGEATITLEDMMVLGGFSVLGGSLSMPLQTKDLVEIQQSLFVILKGGNTHQSQWLNHFMGNGSQFEHEAFLTLWLSRFVFPGNVIDNISKHVFPIAIHLSKGTRIALAPAVLATLYRDLGLLKETIDASAKLGAEKCENSYLALTLWAPLRLVQIWAWERIPPLQPKPNFIKSGYMRLARWHLVKNLNIENVRSGIDSAGDSFHWRPYVMAVDKWLFPKFYKEKEQWVCCNEGFDEETESFARCLRVSELVGMDCIEPYLPHRVAMQFGIDQDLPEWVPRNCMATPEIAWKFYSRPISQSKLYFPPRLFESDVTTRYLEWWKKSVLTPQDAIKGVAKRKRSSRRSKRIVKIVNGVKGGNNADVPPGFPPKSYNNMSSYNDKHLLAAQDHNLSHSTAVSGAFRKMDLLLKPTENIMQSEAAIGRSDAAGKEHASEAEAGSLIRNIVSINHNEEKRGNSFTFEVPVLKLEARISKLERVVGRIKAARFACRGVENGNQRSNL